MSHRPFLQRVCAAAMALWVGACTTLPMSSAPALLSAEDDCVRWFARLDEAVDAHRVRDAQDERIDGLPFLRVDRLALAQRESLSFEDWLARAATLDREARAAEIANLPAMALALDAGVAERAAARARSDACRERLTQQVLADTTLRRAALERAKVPDRYSTAQRALGLYPLVRWPFFAGVQAWQRQHAAAMARWAAAPPLVRRFVPPASASPRAPVFEVEAANGGELAAFDRFGRPGWEGDLARVDVSRPVVFERRSHAWAGGQWLRQEVYTLWFPERPRSGPLDLLGGKLDGVIVRLTYAPDGRVLMLDTIHACGCYHLFFPAPHAQPRADAPPLEEWAFTPARLPALAAGERLAVRIASRTHYVTGVAAAAASIGEPYTLGDENELRSLPQPSGPGRSLYGPDGLVPNTERGERHFFWPMGIASAGAMRQWGHHATAFVGRRHFDDPHLLDQRFELTK